MKERKKLDTQGLELHQNMLALFCEKYQAFAGGLESSESASISNSEESVQDQEAKKQFFDEIMRMKEKLDFSAYQSLIQVENEVDKELARTRSRFRTASMTTAKDRSIDQSPFQRVRLTTDALKTREMEEEAAEAGSNPSSHDPAD